MKFSSLYLHFPFCESKCHYCDLYSLGRERTREGDEDKFEAAMEKECELLSDSLSDRIDTIFMGGGTPSMTPPLVMERSIRALKLPERIHSETEWTMEANPSSIEKERMKAYRSMGINRVSMGVQAMRPDLLKSLGRVHSREEALQALDAVFSAGFDNVSVDLLCGVPGQSLEDVGEAMNALASFPITHLSCYLLTLPPHHRMYKDLPNEDAQLSHLLFIDQFMRSKGFEHYEISNFALPGKRAKHNLVYWQGGSYLGLGPSAHSFDGESKARWKNVSSLHKYAALLGEGKLPQEFKEALTSEQLELEKWMLGLRLADGFPEAWLDSSIRQKRAAQLEENGLLESHPVQSGFKRLTVKGFALSDQVIATLATVG